MKAKELRERTSAELAEMERDLARDLWKTRFANFTNQLDDTAKIRRLRREIARVKTVLNQKKP
jgi:large subunit ribosomal protein L29